MSAEPDPTFEELRRRGAASSYERGEELGHGGMGIVFRVRDRLLRRDLAMKVMREHKNADETEVRKRRFLEEAQVTGQLDHPGIVPVHELGLDTDGHAYFTMRLVKKGRTLQEIIDLVGSGREGWTLTRALGVVLKVCETLAYAHDKGVIHRDLKPTNVMVGRFGETYVMDWGLARVTSAREPRRETESDLPLAASVVRTDRKERLSEDPDSIDATREGDALGTLVYMPPEQAAGLHDRVGARSDVYSVGAILYHLLAGRPPYVTPGQRLTPSQVGERLLLGPPTPLKTIRAGLPEELVAICEKAMARSTDDRYAGTLEIAADIEAYLGKRPVLAHAPSILYALRLAIRRNRAVAMTAAAGLVVLLAVVALALIRIRREVIRADRLADLTNSQVLLDRVENELTPLLAASRSEAEAWIASTRDLLSRADAYRREAANPGPPEEPFTRRTLEELIARSSKLETRLAEVRLDLSRNSAATDRAKLWSEAIEWFRHRPEFAGVRLTPQDGLVPTRRESGGPWEFWMPRTGEEPKFEAGRERPINGDAAIVLLLLPGGDFLMGSSSEGPDFDEEATDDEMYVRLRLAPFFIGKYEVTQGQWERVMHSNPSRYRAGAKNDPSAPSFLHPVESVSAADCDRFVRRIGAALPSEAQWEYAARGNRNPRTRYAHGEDATSLIGTENILDLSFDGEHYALQIDDTYRFHSPVGSFVANAFGLFDVNGNVSEWCRDRYRKDRSAETDLDPDGMLRSEPASGEDRAFRGGTYLSLKPSDYRTAVRGGASPSQILHTRGLRVARKLEPGP